MERKSLGPVRHDIAIICDFCGRMTGVPVRNQKAVAPAWKVYKEAKASAGKVYEEAYASARKVFEEAIVSLHAKECPDCPWDGKTIFPPAEQEGTPK